MMYRNEISSHGIIFGQLLDDQIMKYPAILASGEVWLPSIDDVMYAIPSYIPTDLAVRCDENGGVSASVVSARVEVLKRLRQMEKTIESAYNSVSRKYSNIYDLVKSPNPDEWSSSTLTNICRMISPNRIDDTTFSLAIHKLILDNSLHFIARTSYATTQAFDVRPQSHVDVIQTVQKWSRLRDSPLHSFSEKARCIIHVHQKQLAESHREAPSQSPGTHTWTPDDKIILTFLLNALRPYRTTQSDPYSIGLSAILKMIGPKNAAVNDITLHKTLVNLAVLAPWQDLLVLAPEPRLDPADEDSSLRVKERDALVSKAFSSPPKQGPLGPEDFHLSDPLESVRHDFGDMPVYAIDAKDAEELDDGISIERIPSEPDNFWIHVHIADPASVIPPTHILAKEAAIQGTSTYTLQRSWSLFPRSLMYSSQQGLSLGSQVGAPTRVLTYSTKVNPQGEATDFNVRAGIVRNINITSYDAVDLAVYGALRPMAYPFGGEPPTPTLPSFSESQIQDLRDFALVAERLVNKRYRDGVFLMSGSSTSLDSTRHPNIKSPTLEPSSFRGFPKLTYAVTTFHNNDSGAHGMVAEMMKLGCSAISRFCLQRGVPVLRRAADVPALESESDRQRILDLRMPNCYVLPEDVKDMLIFSGAATYSLEPKGHFSLGIRDGEGYVRGTSPLRRYSDLVVHWQLHHALLGSAAPSIHPPFDERQLLELAVNSKAQERMAGTMKRNHEKYWQNMFIHRWMEDTARGVERHNDPLQNLEGYTSSVPRGNIYVHKKTLALFDIPKLGVRCQVEGLPRTLSKGTEMGVDIVDLSFGIRPKFIVRPKGQS
jgi:exoribonuclease-2